MFATVRAAAPFNATISSAPASACSVVGGLTGADDVAVVCRTAAGTGVADGAGGAGGAGVADGGVACAPFVAELLFVTDPFVARLLVAEPFDADPFAGAVAGAASASVVPFAVRRE